MKGYKLLVFLLSITIIVCLSTSQTYSYFASESKTDIQSIILGNLKIETNNTPENCWVYDAVPVKDNNSIKNDAIDIRALSQNLEAINLRPGDAFTKDISITNIGSLNTKLQITKGTILNNSPFKISIILKEHDTNAVVKNDALDSNIWYIDNLKTNTKVIFTVRLELPIAVTNDDLNKDNITLSNNALELLDIVATQYNNNTKGK